MSSMSSLAAFKSIKVFNYDYAYLDSGAPDSTNYTTWVIFHGMGFNGAIFEKFLPLAHAYNLRIVSVNRRGYPPSSVFQEDELSGIGHGKKIEEATPFYRGQGAEIATFLSQFATEQDIPLADQSSSTGGIVLIGWSLGTIHALSVLAFADELSNDLRLTLGKYFHTLLLHDTTLAALAVAIPEKQDLTLLTEPDDGKRFDAFFYWITGYFTHKSITSGNVDDLEFNIPSELPHSLRELSDEQRARYLNREACGLAGCDGKVNYCDFAVFAVMVKHALFDKARAARFPNVRVRYMGSGESPGILVWPLWVLQKHLEDPRELYGSDAEKARDVKIVHHAEGNHFVFWDHPEKAIQQFKSSIDSWAL